MFKKLSIRLRLTMLSAILLTICCISLTFVLNIYTFRLVDKIDATLITIPPTQSDFPKDDDEIFQKELMPSIPPEALYNAKMGFSIQSVIFMIIIICSGSALTYYISSKALKPLELLNKKVKNINVHNLSDAIDIPLAKDEIAELTKSFNEMTDKLDAVFTNQQNFAASAAHELRTPLAVLQTKIDVFYKKKNHTNEEYDALLVVFKNQVVRLNGLITKLLDMTNMNDYNENSSVLIKDIFEEIIVELSPIAQNKNITITLNSDNYTVFGNVDLLYRAFYNLIENAIKYNNEFGNIDINIIKNVDNQIEIYIKDNGIGIPNEMKEYIFEPFYRVDKSRSRQMGGAGLGLSIVNTIIKKHNGTISVLDNEKSGTCFKITI